MRDNRVVVLFDDFEIAELLIRAGEVPLSKWIRKRVLEGRLTTLSSVDGPAVVYVDRENPAAVKFENKIRDSAVNDGGYKITKISKPKYEPAMDLSIKAACPRCSSRI